jgi:hypothetical protein
MRPPATSGHLRPIRCVVAFGAQEEEEAPRREGGEQMPDRVCLDERIRVAFAAVAVYERSRFGGLTEDEAIGQCIAPLEAGSDG